MAGRALSPLLLAATVLAANIGAGSTVGAAGLGYSQGIGAWWWVGSAAIGTMVLAWWVGPRIWKLAALRGYLTVGDFLEDRYGAALRGVIAALLWVGTLSILAGQLIALAWVLNVVAGLPKFAGCLIGGAVMTTYFTAGGLHGSARVNLVQLIALLAGFALAFPLALGSVGGFEGLAGSLGSSAGAAGPDYLDFFGGGPDGTGSWLYYLVLLAPAFVISPGLIQKVYGAQGPRAIRWGVGLSALALVAFAAVPAVLGMVARVSHPGLSHPELALPTVLMHNVPPAVGGLGLGALFVADLSSADAILFMLATSLSQDLYRRFVNREASDRRVLGVARLAAIAGGGLGTVLAIVSPSVVGALSIFYSILGVSLFVPVLAGIYRGRAGVPEAMAAVVGGILLMLVVRFTAGAGGVGVLTPNLVGILGGAGAFVAVLAGRVSRES